MVIRKSVLIIFTFLLFPMFLFSGETPEILWRYAAGGRIVTAPVEGRDGTLYFGSEDRYLYAVLKDGALKWRLNLVDRITETLAISPDETIYTGSKKGFLIAVNSHGRQIWKLKLNGEPFGTPAIDSDGTIFVSTTKGWFYSISHTGFIHWEVKLPYPPALSPVIGKDVYIGLSNERVYSYGKNGEIKWIFLLSGQAVTIALSESSIYVGTDYSTLVSINNNGRKNWNRSFSNRVSSVIVLSPDRIMCTYGSSLSLLDSSGNSLWERRAAGTITDLAALSDTAVMINSTGSLFWTDMEGTPLGSISGGAPGNKFLLSAEGDVYVGSMDWLFYKYGFRKLVFSNYNDYLWPSYRNSSGNSALLTLKNLDTPEDSYIRSNDYLYLMEMAESSVEENLQMVLDEIGTRIFSRDYDRGKAYFKPILEFIASEGIRHPLYQDGVLINNFPLIRSGAVELLGITGDLDTVKFLSDLMEYEWDNYAIYSIIKSLGYLQSDYNMEMSESIVNFSGKYNKSADTQITSQLLITIQKMFNYKGSINRRLLDIIVGIFMDSSSREVKELALDTIQVIQGQ